MFSFHFFLQANSPIGLVNFVCVYFYFLVQLHTLVAKYCSPFCWDFLCRSVLSLFYMKGGEDTHTHQNRAVDGNHCAAVREISSCLNTDLCSVVGEATAAAAAETETETEDRDRDNDSDSDSDSNSGRDSTRCVRHSSVSSTQHNNGSYFSGF